MDVPKQEKHTVKHAIKDCLITVDSNERFVTHITDLYEWCDTYKQCDEYNWIRLVCKYHPNIGVIYNDEVVFTIDEIKPYFKGIDTNYDKNEIDYNGLYTKNVKNFLKSNSKTNWYYFYCAPNTSKEHLNEDGSSSGILLKPGGFILSESDRDYRIGYMGAHVHIDIPVT